MSKTPVSNAELVSLMSAYSLRDMQPKRPHFAKELISIHRARYREALYDPLARRERLAQRVRDCEENGRVALIVEGMDCDCVQGLSVSLCRPAPRYIEYLIGMEYDNAEGPTSCWIEKPSQAPEAYTRDLAMEAFEDGHPHSVSTTRFTDDDGLDWTEEPATSSHGLSQG